MVSICRELPLTAKYLYEKYTEHFKEQEQIRIWDPSAGWGGRILGAMSVADDRNIHYIGTDPNTGFTVILQDGSKSTKYAELAKVFNEKSTEATDCFTPTHTKYCQVGSETLNVKKTLSTWYSHQRILCRKRHTVMMKNSHIRSSANTKHGWTWAFGN